jgi:uncharacterized protein YdbL (DUF1318 family)
MRATLVRTTPHPAVRACVALLLMLLALPGWSIGLDEAKASGAIGEQSNGYLGIVRTPASPELRDLVSSVNAQRRQRYQAIADRNDITLEQVELLAGKKAIEKTQSGHWVRLPDGEWVPK